MSDGRSPPRRPTADHKPQQPSHLRQSYTASSPSAGIEAVDHAANYNSSPELSPLSPPARPDTEVPLGGPSLSQPILRTPNEQTALLRGWLHEDAHEGPCNHGTFSPRPQSPGQSSTRASDADQDSLADRLPVTDIPVLDSVIARMAPEVSWRRRWAARMRSKKMSTSSVLAQQAGFKDTTAM